METTILVIEDDEDIQHNIVEILVYEGMTCLVAPDGPTGVHLAQNSLPDLIISDVMMPGITGYEVLQALQQEAQTATIPFVFLTAKADTASLRYGMDLGADDYLTKPFTSDELINAITRRLQKKAQMVQEYTKQTTDLRQTLIHSLPHELLTPLTGILMGAQMMRGRAKKLNLSEMVEMAEVMWQSGSRLQRLIENYIAFARLQMAHLDPEWLSEIQQTSTDMPGSVIKTVAEDMVNRARRMSDLRVDVEGGVVGVSSEHLQKIVEELTDNACKFSTPQSPIVISAHWQEGDYQLRIADHGRGMSPEQVKQVGALKQFGRDIYEQQGSGLGLTIAQHLAKLHRGSLFLQSEAERGTTILVRLPPPHQDGEHTPQD